MKFICIFILSMLIQTVALADSPKNTLEKRIVSLENRVSKQELNCNKPESSISREQSSSLFNSPLKAFFDDAAVIKVVQDKAACYNSCISQNASCKKQEKSPHNKDMHCEFIACIDNCGPL